MNSILVIVLSFLLASAAHGGPVTAVVKIAEKVAARSADNVAEKVVVRNADDAAKLAAKGAGKTATHVAPAVERTVVRSAEPARAEATAAKPAVKAATRKTIVRPGNIAATGLAIGTGDAAHNLTAGEKEKARALAAATRETLAEHPEMLADVLRADGETGFLNRAGAGIGSGVGRGLVWFAALVGGGFGLAALIRALPARRRRKPCEDNASDRQNRKTETKSDTNQKQSTQEQNGEATNHE